MNPFIRLLEAPVETLTLAGYVIIMVAITLAGSAYIARVGSMLVLSMNYNARRMGNGRYDAWWGDLAGGYIPPEKWIRDAALVSFVGVVMLWALATVVYIA